MVFVQKNGRWLLQIRIPFLVKSSLTPTIYEDNLIPLERISFWLNQWHYNWLNRIVINVYSIDLQNDLSYFSEDTHSLNWYLLPAIKLKATIVTFQYVDFSIKPFNIRSSSFVWWQWDAWLLLVCNTTTLHRHQSGGVKKYISDLNHEVHIQHNWIQWEMHHLNWILYCVNRKQVVNYKM